MSLNYTPLRRRIALRDRFREVLAKAMEERDQRPDLVDTPEGAEFEWVLFERGVMHAEVNRCRAEAGLPDVPIDVVERAERQAIGHVDYHPKYALYCAEIVMDDPRSASQDGEPQ